MFKSYVEPWSFGDEEREVAALLLERRAHRLATWNEHKYIAVMEDLYGRLRDDGPKVARALALGLAGTDLETLDTFVINCSALAVVRGLLEVPPSTAPRVP